MRKIIVPLIIIAIMPALGCATYDIKITKLQIVGIPDEYLEEVNKVTNLVAKELLDKYPVYTLKPTEAKSSSAKSVVKNVVIRDGVLIITVGI